MTSHITAVEALTPKVAEKPQLIVVVGLAFEGRVARLRMHVVCSADGRNLAASVRRAIVNCRGLVSFGLAGGLSPGLPAGACVVGSAILSGKTRLVTDHTWSQTVLRAIPDAVHGMIVGVPAPIAQPAAKHALFLKTGAVAVDTESHIVASVAATHRLPMLAIRVIIDPTDRRLPEVALAMVRQNGTLDIAMLIRSLIKQPREVPALLRTALDAAAAQVTLLRNRRLLGPSFGLTHSIPEATS